MKLSTLCLATAFLATAAGASFAQNTPMTEADCTAWLTKVDANADGSLDATEGKVFQDKLTGANMKTKDANMMTKDEFMQNCQAGNFAGVPMSQ
jgi:hypothetical protein